MRALMEFVQFAVVVALVVPALHLAFGAYARRREAGWSEALERRRLAIVVILVCLVAGVQIAEDVLDCDSRPIDEAILLYLHEHVPPPIVAFFEAVTLTGSSKVLTS